MLVHQVGLSGLVVIWVGTLAAAQDVATPAGKLLAAARAGQERDAPTVEPTANQVLRRMSDYLKGLGAFHFETENVFDVVEPGGQKSQLSRRVEVDFRRPNALRGRSEGDHEWDTAYWYDGRRVAILQRKLNVYSVVDAPATTDEMLDYMNERYGLAVPTADLLFSDVYAVLMDEVQTGRIVGEHRVGPRRCYHLAFTQSKVDWQLWVDVGQPPLPRKLVVTYKQAEGCPQFSATFLEWDTAPTYSDADFQFAPPEDAQKIDLIPRELPEAPPESADDVDESPTKDLGDT
jgi:hypothetical protein